MNDFEGKSNNEILIEIKEMEFEHEEIKRNMLNILDKFDELKKDLLKVEKRHSDANLIINKRLKGDII
jgi:hypothetical protein